MLAFSWIASLPIYARLHHTLLSPWDIRWFRWEEWADGASGTEEVALLRFSKVHMVLRYQISSRFPLLAENKIKRGWYVRLPWLPKIMTGYYSSLKRKNLEIPTCCQTNLKSEI
jgi:hypothetical protein